MQSDEKLGLLGTALFAVPLFALLAASAGCTATTSMSGGTGGAGTGGQSGTSTGGTSGGGSGGASACTSVSACGGSVVGQWEVMSSCLSYSGDLDISILSLGCPKVTVTGSITAAGTFTANSDGTYTDNSTTKGSISFPLPSSCLSISSVPVACDKAADIFKASGWTSTSCTPASGGGCDCTLKVDRQGGLGFVSDLAVKMGHYMTSGNTLTTDDLHYDYCTSGDQLTLTPQTSALQGTVVLKRTGEGGSGTGGSSSGGASGSGGSSSGGAGGGSSSGGAGGASSGGTGGAASGGAGGRGTGSGGAGGSSGTGGAGGSGTGTGGAGGSGTGSRPCDIYAAGNTPCVAAHSTVRALFGSYSGNLYQVKRARTA